MRRGEGGGWGFEVSEKLKGLEKKRKDKKERKRVELETGLCGRKERCGSMCETSVTLMNYLRLEIPQPSRGLSAAL